MVTKKKLIKKEDLMGGLLIAGVTSMFYFMLTFQAPTPQNGQTHSGKTIRWLLPTNCLSMFDHVVGLALNGLK